MEETQIAPNTGELEEEHLYSELSTGDGKQGRDSGQQPSGPGEAPRKRPEQWCPQDSRPCWGSVLCRKGFCRWEAAVGCVGVGCCSLRCFLLPSAHDSLSSSAQLFSNHESARQTPFG